MSPNVTHVTGTWLLSGATIFLSTSTSVAQIVSVSPGGGVHVRAPFVRVDVFPYDGGVSVRAPFAAVDVPGEPYYYRPGPIVVDRPVASPSFIAAQDLSTVDDETLRRILRSRADRLNARLGNFDTGATWQRYLRLQAGITEDAMTEGRREALTKLQERFRNVVEDPKYAMIAELPDFTAVETALAEMIWRLDNSSGENGVMPEELPAPSRPVQPTPEERR
jgi:hypothetical protein